MTEETPRDDAFHLAGDRLGKFVVLSELGRGSMGVVYEALQEDLKRKVALKILPANITLDARQVRRFHREAESVARLRHDNVIQIYEVGEIDKTHYFAMELVDGQPLGEAFGRDKDSVMRAARIAMQAARGLAHAHERGVIHRDVKPSNLLLDRTGRVVVTDFGLARLTDSASLTSTDAIVGTPKYMSPEQILPGAKPLDGRTDIYSLGATLYHVIAGRPPFEAPSVQAFIRSVMEDRAPSPRRFNRQVPHDLATIILRCLEKDPADRYANAADFADDLERFLAGERIHAKPKGLFALGYESARRHRIIATFSAIALVGLVLILILGGQVDYLEELDEIRDQANLDLAVQRIEELAQRRPDDERVQRARRDIYHERALEGLLDVRAKAERIAGDLEQAGMSNSFWHLYMLLEARQYDRVRVAADALPQASPLRHLFLARLDVEDGDFESAVEHLRGPPEADVNAPTLAYHYFVLGKAHRGLALATAEPSVQLLALAKTQLKQARAATGSHAAWLANRIETEFQGVRTELGESVNLEDLIADVRARLIETRRTLVQLWGSMTPVEARVAERYLDRVLEMSDLDEVALTSAELESRARQWLLTAKGHDRVLAHLLLGVASLSRRRVQAALEALDNADRQGDEQLAPYVYWGMSLAHRSQDEIPMALELAVNAIELAGPMKPQFVDFEPLFRHTTLLLEEARRRTQEADTAEKFLRVQLEKRNEVDEEPWVDELLERVTSRAGAPAGPR
ncbi:MAG: protein kinase domain-containing protein [Planctomycetota bacterium]|jgi:predicted Ser/Thr protein kinase/tetratricopeptide (TPR) repeat protein